MDINRLTNKTDARVTVKRDSYSLSRLEGVGLQNVGFSGESKQLPLFTCLTN